MYPFQEVPSSSQKNLCGHQLPWVEKILHLGNTLTNDTNIVYTDMNIKNARYIVKNIEINQKFNFSAAATLSSKAKISFKLVWKRLMGPVLSTCLQTRKQL